jgi:hypothetical protein
VHSVVTHQRTVDPSATTTIAHVAPPRPQIMNGAQIMKNPKIAPAPSTNPIVDDPIAVEAPPAPVEEAPPVVAPREVAAHVDVPPPHASAPAPVSTLGAETAMLDRARKALAAHDPAGATRAIDEYEATYPHGKLHEEASVARIEAALAQGNAASAVNLANAFEADFPASA